MKFFFLFISLFFTIFGCTSPHQPVDDYGFNDYALYDHSGKFHRLSNYNNNKAIILFVQGNGCPMVRQEYPEFEKIITDYEKDGFLFFMINSNTQDDREAIRKEAKKFNWRIPVLHDSAQLLAEELDITVTTEVIVLNPTTREILYRGPINDKYSYETQKENAENEYLRIVLDDISEDKKPSITKKFAKGCKVNRISGNKEKQLTYTKDIAPILRDNCVKCHNDNGIAPWSMKDYKTINGWAPMIKEVLIAQRMPPYKADPFIGELKERQHLEDSSANKLLRWINDGAPYGIGEDELAKIPPQNLDWELGIPDEIFTMPEIEIPATGILDYYNQELELRNSDTKWLKGIAVKYSNQKVVHHVVLDLESDSLNPINNRRNHRWVDNFIAAMNPGYPSIEYPEDTGVYLKENAIISLQTHYTTTGVEEKNTTQIGLYYADSPPAKKMYSIGTAKYNFKIAPYEPRAKFTAQEFVNKDIKLYSSSPHMHYRGKSMMIKVIYPNKRIDTILSVPDYNFNWQWLYKFKEPINIPAGSIVEVDAVFDNSYQNTFNPDPSKNVIFGIQSSQEMMIAVLNYTLDDE